MLKLDILSKNLRKLTLRSNCWFNAGRGYQSYIPSFDKLGCICLCGSKAKQCILGGACPFCGHALLVSLLGIAVGSLSKELYVFITLWFSLWDFSKSHPFLIGSKKRFSICLVCMASYVLFVSLRLQCNAFVFSLFNV